MEKLSNNSVENKKKWFTFFSKKVASIKNTILAVVFWTVLSWWSVLAKNNDIDYHNNELILKEHIVKFNDTFYNISRYYKVDVNDLFDANPSYKFRQNLIFPWEKIIIPLNKVQIAKLKNKEIKNKLSIQPSYKVKKNDRLLVIASNFNIDYNKLLKFNPQISNPDIINVWDIINLTGLNDEVVENNQKVWKIEKVKKVKDVKENVNINETEIKEILVKKQDIIQKVKDYNSLDKLARNKKYTEHKGGKNFIVKNNLPLKESRINHFNFWNYFIYTYKWKSSLIVKNKNWKYINRMWNRPKIYPLVKIVILSKKEFENHIKRITKLAQQKILIEEWKDPVYYALKAFDDKDTLWAQHCTDWVDHIYELAFWNSVYNFDKKFEGISWTKIKSWTWILPKKYASKIHISKIKPWDHIIVDRPSNGEYKKWKTHSLVALESPNNWLIKVISMSKYNTPPVIEMYDLFWKWRWKNGLVIRIQWIKSSDTTAWNSVTSIHSESKLSEEIKVTKADTSNITKLKQDNNEDFKSTQILNSEKNKKVNKNNIINFDDFYESDIYSVNLNTPEKVNELLTDKEKEIIQFIQKKHWNKKILGWLEVFTSQKTKRKVSHIFDFKERQKKEKIIRLFEKTHGKLKNAA